MRLALQARNDSRQVVTDPSAHYFGWVEVDEHTLVPGDDAQLGTIRFEDWLHQTAPVA